MSESGKQAVWIFDPLAIKEVNVCSDATTFKIIFLDFLGIQKEVVVSRNDCYFDFMDRVLAPMVSLGYRYNTSIANAPNLIQTAICSYRPNPEALKKAIAAWKEKNKAQIASDETESTVGSNAPVN